MQFDEGVAAKVQEKLVPEEIFFSSHRGRNHKMMRESIPSLAL